MDYQEFETRKDAQFHIDYQMQGWPRAKVERIETDDGSGRCVWVIRADRIRYLRRDGFVR